MAKPEPKIVVDNKAKLKNTPNTPKAPGLVEALLAFEGEVLSAPDRLHLKHIAVNRAKTLLPDAQFFLVLQDGHKFSLKAITNQPTINAQSPFIQWLMRNLRNIDKGKEKSKTDRKARRPLSKPYTFTFKSLRADDDFEYSLPYACWAPFSPTQISGGLLLTKDTPWSDAQTALAERVGKIVGAQWIALTRRRKKLVNIRKRALVSALGLSLAAILCLPVPMTTMAPAEVVAKAPFIVSAPMDGVIDEILVKPGSLVKKGDILARLNDVTFRNEFNLASEESAVASARLQQISLSAFIDDNARRELAIKRAEQGLAQARQTYANDQLLKTNIGAKRDGLIIFSDEKDWVGRPVAIGEKIMEIADPARVLLRLESPIADSVTLRRGARVRVFLDSEPLRPLEATLIRSYYYAQPTPSGTLAYQAYADLEPLKINPRIGSRGVAKIYAESAPLGLWLARRPIVSFRQKFGF